MSGIATPVPIAIAADAPWWPQFRGPGGTGIAAPAENPPVEFGPGKRMLWKTALPSGHSSPVGRTPTKLYAFSN